MSLYNTAQMINCRLLQGFFARREVNVYVNYEKSQKIDAKTLAQNGKKM